MNGKFLLDTNIVVALFKDDPAIHERLRQRPRVLVSIVVLGELYYGAQKSERLDKNLRQINRFLTRAAVLQCDAATAYEYGLVRNELRIKGRPIPENDVWIAAAARQHDFTLVSRDHHFAEVENLRWEQW
ncbi:MAG: type II toxin-antitoxin system VapC family toxin [Planctomycetes bacterium]|nr:type II toxin-antitoxin system VapC family toxin [Planctomycetota bacterium]MBU4398686.1 type II toxin-antitoxin system VapC family toxin [Planctomycetota bacterium]MCG2684389.1 type II toxin-antitoxin system VapC family toxin [Planctomycetales bacterium]